MKFWSLFSKKPWKGWTVLPNKRCPVCKGEILFRRCGGMWSDGTKWDGYETICPACGKDTVDDPFVPDNDNPEREAAPDTNGWVLCPCCGYRFKATDWGAFKEGRHRRCGQALRITGAINAVDERNER